MAKVFAVLGATGQQGGAIIDFVLSDSELSKEYNIRAITRDTSSDKAKALAEKVEVVTGDVSDASSLEKALTGVHTVFVMTTPVFTPDGMEREYETAKSIADIVVKSGVNYLIFSTLPSVRDLSGGKYTGATQFDAKAAAEKYIRDLPIKSAFYSPGAFMENFQFIPGWAPEKVSDDTWAVIQHLAPTTRIPLINTGADTGKYIGAILADPDKYEGKTFCAATALYSLEDIARTISKSSGRKVVYKQVSAEEFSEVLPDILRNPVMHSLSNIEEFGCYGPDTDELVQWSVDNARGKLTTFEEYLEAHPLKFEPAHWG